VIIERCDAFSAFIERLRAFPRVVVQAHDFPDHDAVSAAFALNYLLGQLGLNTLLVYCGLIDRISIQRMIDDLDIPIHLASDCELQVDDKTIVVDGCGGEKNVTGLLGDEVGVIDHHHVKPSQDLWFDDVRSEYGATASILVEYFQYFNIEIPKAVATALQVGLSIDTANLTRGFCEADVAAFAVLHQIADQYEVNRLCRNSLEFHELQYYQHMLDDVKIVNNVAMAELPESCPKNLLGLLGDFLIAVDNVDVTLLASPKADVIQLSLRSKTPRVDVAEVARQVLADGDLGFGGGHSHMAGGVVHKQQLPDGNQNAAYVFDLFLDRVLVEI
jgi:nanoRNase/pAp phosphatase (c-di-AMP/oligoRNAs hydrolase)